MRLPSPIVSSNSLKKIASSYIYVRQERSSSETNDRAPRTFTRFYAKKKRIKEKKKKKKERPFALTEGYFLLHCFWKSEKRTVFYTWPSGRYQVNILRTPSFQVNNPYISVGCKTHLQKRLSITWDTQAQKNNIWHCWCWLPPNIKRKKVVLKSEIFGYLWIIDWRYYQSSDFLLIFSKVFVLLENQEFRNFLIVLYKR